MQKTKSSSSTTTTYRGQRDLQSRFQKRNSTHRRQGDLLEIHPCVLQDIPGFPATRPSKGIPDIPVVPGILDIPVIHDLPAFPGNSTSSSISRESNPFQHSPIRMHILQNSTVRLVSTENSTEYQLSNNILQTLHSSKKGRCCDIGQIDIFSRIELFPSIVLSSDNTNCKNDIQ